MQSISDCRANAKSVSIERKSILKLQYPPICPTKSVACLPAAFEMSVAATPVFIMKLYAVRRATALRPQNILSIYHVIILLLCEEIEFAEYSFKNFTSGDNPNSS